MPRRGALCLTMHRMARGLGAARYVVTMHRMARGLGVAPYEQIACCALGPQLDSSPKRSAVLDTYRQLPTLQKTPARLWMADSVVLIHGALTVALT